jgi:hypothetical protein
MDRKYRTHAEHEKYTFTILIGRPKENNMFRAARHKWEAVLE